MSHHSVALPAKNWAPIALFIYNRPHHVRRTIESLGACDGFDASPLYVFADGPRSRDDTPAVHEARTAAHELLGARATFVEQETNRGLANSIIAGVSALCERHGSAIVVEDDLLLSPWFLRFLNDALVRYRDEPRVMQISGHMFDVPELRDQRDALFLPMVTSWGWATWKRAWASFDPEAIGWRQLLDHQESRRRFDLGDAYPYSNMLERQMTGRVDSWAIRWYYTLFRSGGLSLFPPRTLVVNGGQDRSGTHGRRMLRTSATAFDPGPDVSFPSDIVESPLKDAVFAAIDASQPGGVWANAAKRTYRSLERILLPRVG